MSFIKEAQAIEDKISKAKELTQDEFLALDDELITTQMEKSNEFFEALRDKLSLVQIIEEPPPEEEIKEEKVKTNNGNKK